MTNEEIEETDGSTYSRKISEYFYVKLSDISIGDDFTQSDAEEYPITISNGKIDISNTTKLINYLKSFVKKSVSDINTDIDNKVDVDDYQSDKQTIEDDIDDIKSELEEIGEKIYPVGSVYISFANTNPSTLFGGVWEEIEDKFLLASGTKNVGTNGGEELHVLTSSEMPSHTHIQNEHNHIQNAHNHGMAHTHNHRHQVGTKEWSTGSGNDSGRVTAANRTTGYKYTDYNNASSSKSVTDNSTATNKATTAINQATGGGQAHNNMPPYLVVHMWRRIL